MNHDLDDDSGFWDDPGFDPDRTSQIQRVRRHSSERTRTHHVVTRDLTRDQPIVRLDDEATMWFEPEHRLARRFGPLGSVDPRLLSVGAIAFAAVLAVPLFAALGDNGNGDSMRSINEQTTTTTSTTIAVPVTTVAEVVVTAGADPDISGDLENDVSGDAESSSQGETAAQPQGLRSDPGCSNQYTAGAGDYWLLVADGSGTSLDELLQLNKATTETPIYPGDTICLPDGATVAGGGGSGTNVAAVTQSQQVQCANTYQAAAGDYWLGIAERAGISLDELLAANGATPDTPLYPGSEVCLPAGAAVPTAPTSSAVVTTAAPTTAAASTAPATSAPPTTEAPTTAPPTTEAETTVPPPPPPPPAEIEQIIRDAWPDDVEEQALRIAWRESSYDPTASNYCCHGLFQIHWEAHREWLATMGVDEVSDLYDAVTNAQIAYALYERSGGWGPWAQTAD